MKHPGMFEHFAKATMNEIMEKYLLYIYSKFLEYDPLSSVDFVEEYTRTIDSETSSLSLPENAIPIIDPSGFFSAIMILRSGKAAEEEINDKKQPY